MQDAFQQQGTRAAMEGGKLLASFAKLADIARRSGRMLAERGLEACRDVDGILAGFGGLLIGYSRRVALGGLPPRAPTDPHVQIFRMRFFRS